MFLKFMFFLGVGLIGLSMVLKTVLETLFADWDVAAELRLGIRRQRVWMRHVLDYRRDEEHGHQHGGINAYGRPSRPQQQTEARPLPAPAEETRELAGVS